MVVHGHVVVVHCFDFGLVCVFDFFVMIKTSSQSITCSFPRTLLFSCSFHILVLILVLLLFLALFVLYLGPLMHFRPFIQKTVGRFGSHSSLCGFVLNKDIWCNF